MMINYRSFLNTLLAFVLLFLIFALKYVLFPFSSLLDEGEPSLDSCKVPSGVRPPIFLLVLFRLFGVLILEFGSTFSLSSYTVQFVMM